MTGRFAENPDYRRYEELLKQVHHLIAIGKGDSDEADELRERMDAPWYRLSDAERARLDGLSADLYMLQDDEVTEKPVPADLSLEAFGNQISYAQEWNDWDAVLGLLRHRPAGTLPQSVAAWRARAYDALGHFDTAILFLDYAFKANPTDPSYLGLRMMFLSGANRLEEAALDAQRFIDARDTQPLLVIASADVLLQAAERRLSGATSEVHQRILEALRPVLRERGAATRIPVGYFVIGQLVRALCLCQMGDLDATLAAIDAALEADPGDRVLRRIKEQAAREIDREVRALALSEALDHARDLARRTVPTRLAA
jgi:tetratricopeptide (TPR) repeat protein